MQGTGNTITRALHTVSSPIVITITVEKLWKA